MEMIEVEQPAFRPSKRQKVIRRRADDAGDSEAHQPQNEANEEAITERTTHETRLKRPRHSRKHGMTFASSAPVPELKHADERALVVASTGSSSDQMARFTKSTGQAVITEDKHMLAFIDARLTEIRSDQKHPPQLQDNNFQEEPSSYPLNAKPVESTISETKAPSRSDRSDSAFKGAERPPAKAKKRRNAPSAADIERDKLVEQLMHENSSSIYDTGVLNQSAKQNDEMDNDVAAANAFKLNFLADLEERNYARRQPAIPQNTAGGPRLGGSRADREKMKALEETAKGKTASGQSGVSRA